jgi:hypothetical protein
MSHNHSLSLQRLAVVLSVLRPVAAEFLASVKNASEDLLYSTNVVCRKRFCINPIFPGLEDMDHLEQRQWFCADMLKVRSLMGFCRDAVDYAVALPVPTEPTDDMADIVGEMDDAATTAFMYHLAGMGLEAWDYPEPQHADDCVRSVWRSLCHTFFPRQASPNCAMGSPTQYLRPCQSSCHNYIKACNVECCDESVQCVFQHKKSWGFTQIGEAKHVTMQTGFAPHDGPSSLCTGGAFSSTQASHVLLALVMTASWWEHIWR